MNKKNDISEIKEAIKQLIFENSVKVYRFACNSKDEQYQKLLDFVNLKPFSISRDTFRKVDKIRVVNGKKTWLYKFAIQELVDEGALVLSSSYCPTSSHAYAKSYALTLDKLHEILPDFEFEIHKPFKLVESEFDELSDFMDGYEVYNTDGKWLSDVYYTKAEKEQAKRELEKEKAYIDYCKCHKNTDIFTQYETDKFNGMPEEELIKKYNLEK